ncbi:MAG: hypothetical protein ACO1QB_01280 [Verrucomicrobiales bacterium]
MNLNRSNQRGVALVITLIMLAIVTVMAIIFLGVTRRERSAVKVTEDLYSAKNAADVALEMAKAQAIAEMSAFNSRLRYDLFVSTNYVNPSGFTPQGNTEPDPYNVSYTDANGNLLTGDNYLQNIRNLQFTPRVPVFVETNNNGDSEFRYYLDFDRNRVFATNGLTPIVLDNGQILSTNGVPISPQNFNEAALSFKVGDPEWFGTLQHPDQPHSESNRFVFRSAFIALPAGKTLDLNYVHNHVSPAITDDIMDQPAGNGFLRNQGVGSWEINLAAFLRDLNTNNYAWHNASYAYNPPTDGSAPGINVARGETFNDARALLGYRYLRNRATQPPASAFFNPPREIELDNIDNYGDGPLVFFNPINENANNASRDNVNRPFPGAPSTNAFYDVQELFTLGTYSAEFSAFTNRLMQANAANRLSSYDKYTFYRLLSQMGVDSAPAIKDKVHLNYRNTPGMISTNLQPWTNSVEFFALAADKMLKASIVTNTYPTNIAGTWQIYTNYTIGDTLVRPNISVTNIQIWHQPLAISPYNTSNEYSAAIHRILQVAANVYDGLTNRTGGFGNRWRSYPHYPAVFKPIFTKTATNLYISDFIEVENADWLSSTPFLTLEEYLASNNTVGETTNAFLYGQPLVIGAKKGHPNFNEFSVESVVQVSRKMELVKNTQTGPAVATNQMFIVNIDNLWGIEGWNSYARDYNRDVTISADISSLIVLSNVTRFTSIPLRYGTNYASTNLTVSRWPGTGTNMNLGVAGNFQVPIYSPEPLLRDAVYVTNRGNDYFITNAATASLFQPIIEPPQMQLYTTNRIRYWVVDKATGRIIDFVNLDKLVTHMNVSGMMNNQSRDSANGVNGLGVADPSLYEGEFWTTNLLGATPFTSGMSNQLAVSLGDIPVSESFWRNYNYQTQDKPRSIDAFRLFLGLPQIGREQMNAPTDLRHQVPFTPTRKLYQRNSWQANDPLVHYMANDLRNPRGPDRMIVRPPNLPVSQESGLGKMNELYRPWGNSGIREAANSPYAYNMQVKDPGVRGSDDWNFPITLTTNGYFRFANIGWLGRIHRGTPWQTIYLKSGNENTTNWFNWAGSWGTHPIYDWKLLDVFTAAPSEEATRGLLSVNQTHTAAWSAVLSGVPVISNSIPNAQMNANLDLNLHPNPFTPYFIQPGTAQISNIVQSLNNARASILTTNWVFNAQGVPEARVFQKNVFHHIGSVLAAPALTMRSPFLNMTETQPLYAFTDEVVERIPQQIMSLLQLDEPRFVVYSFGQSLRPAPRSLVTSAQYYGLCTNYQVTGEVITKTTFRVEGDVSDPSNPLRAVVENYKVLPPPE